MAKPSQSVLNHDLSSAQSHSTGGDCSDVEPCMSPSISFRQHTRSSSNIEWGAFQRKHFCSDVFKGPAHLKRPSIPPKLVDAPRLYPYLPSAPGHLISRLQYSRLNGLTLIEHDQDIHRSIIYHHATDVINQLTLQSQCMSARDAVRPPPPVSTFNASVGTSPIRERVATCLREANTMLREANATAPAGWHAVSELSTRPPPPIHGAPAPRNEGKSSNARKRRRRRVLLASGLAAANEETEEC